LSVLQIDNARRVRDGYISESTCGHSRTPATGPEGLVCRTNVPALAHACTRLPPLDFHGKEGVDGSSPSEGSAKSLQTSQFRSSRLCRCSSVRWIWSRSWSLQVRHCSTKAPRPGSSLRPSRAERGRRAPGTDRRRELRAAEPAVAVEHVTDEINQPPRGVRDAHR
jgi:hypothetical protein